MSDQYSTEFKAKVAMLYGETKSPTEVRRRMQCRSLPDKTIKRWYENLISQGRLTLPRGGSAPSVRVSTNIRSVDEMVHSATARNEPTSTRRLSAMMEEAGKPVSRSSIHRILRKDLAIKPYHVRKTHELKEMDKPRRVAMARSLLEKHQEDPDFFRKIVWTDEAKFELSGAVNTHNTIYWAESNPNITVDAHRINQQGLMVWAGVWADGRLGPFTIEDNRLNGEKYLDLLQNQIIPALGDTSELYWMQDGAPCHGKNAVKNYLREVFGDRVIALGWDPEWAPRSPDLTVCDFYLWGRLKGLVYGKRHEDLEELEEEITRQFDMLDAEEIEQACLSVEERMKRIIEMDGESVQYADGR
uniref:DUF4817 domain-containing protein n=1 Tax=Tetranychus urticae TaxID=32264 RepID=T1K3R3_TETUR